MNFLDELLHLRRALDWAADQAEAVERARQSLKRTAPGRGFVHLTPMALPQGSARWLGPADLVLSGFPRPLRFAYANRDFVVWTPHSAPDTQFLKWMDQTSDALGEAMRSLPPPKQPCLIAGRQAIELELQATLTKFGKASLGCLKLQGFDDVAGFLGPRAAEALMEESRLALEMAVPGLPMARYRNDRFLLIGTSEIPLDSIWSHTEAVLTRSELPVGVTSKEIQAVLTDGTALDWIREVERLANDAPHFCVGLRSAGSLGGQDEGPFITSPRRPLPPTPRLFSSMDWPDHDSLSS